MKLLAGVRVRNGKLEFKQRSSFLSDVSKLGDGDYTISLEKNYKKRSLMQNAYYWGVVVPIVKSGLNDIGYKLTTDATHEFLKGQFNIVEIVNEQSGEILKSVGSTTQMTTSQMMEYFAHIRQWGAEYLNVNIPEPNEQLKIEL